VAVALGDDGFGCVFRRYAGHFGGNGNFRRFYLVVLTLVAEPDEPLQQEEPKTKPMVTAPIEPAPVQLRRCLYPCGGSVADF